MVEIIEYPLDDGGVLRIQSASVDSQRDDLGLASSAGEMTRKAGETLEASLAQVTPALEVVADKLKGLSSDALTVEFGLTLTAETGIVVAKGSAEVHFTVTLAWSKDAKKPASRPRTVSARRIRLPRRRLGEFRSRMRRAVAGSTTPASDVQSGRAREQSICSPLGG
jgi:hypothetical protein